MPGPSPDEWVAAFRRAVDQQRQVFAEHVGIEARSAYEGVGEGGDNTLVIDHLCEDAVFEQLDALHADGHAFTAISEERGTVEFGDSSDSLTVVIDPIDGSLNARRTIPCHSLSVAVASGETMADVTLGYVYEFGAGEEFAAVAGEGATLDGEAISAFGEEGLEVIGMEATKPERVLAAAQALQGVVYRLRSPGSIAVSLCFTAAARFDGMITTRNCRSVDCAAGQLIVREAQGALCFDDGELSDAPLSLDSRYDVAAARTPADLERLRDAQRQIP